MRIIAKTHVTAAGRGYPAGSEIPADKIADPEHLVALGVIEVEEPATGGPTLEELIATNREQTERIAFLESETARLHALLESLPRGSDDPDAGKHLNPPPPGHGQIDLTAFEAPAKRPRSR